MIFSGWSGIFKQIIRIFEIHYKNQWSLKLYKNYMQCLKEKDYKDFTKFWQQLPIQFRKNQITINHYFDSKNFGNINKKFNKNPLIEIQKNYHHFNYEKSIEITVPDIWFHSNKRNWRIFKI